MRRFLEKPNPDEITCNTINAGIYVLEPATFDRIPKDTPYSIERSYFPSLVERGETFVAYVYRRLLDRHRHARQVRAGAPRHHGRRFAAAPFAGTPAARTPTARASRTGADRRGPCFIDEGAVVKAGAASSPTRSSAGSATSRKAARRPGSIVWPNSWIGRDARVDDAILGRNCHVGRNVVVQPGRVLGDKTVITDFSQV